MSPVLSVFRREFASYFATPLAAVFLVIFLALAGAFTFYLGGFYEAGQADLQPFLLIQQRLQASHDRQDVQAFVEDSYSVMRAALPFADNPYLQETIENLQPSMSRNYYLALEQRKAEMGDFLELFAQLLHAVVERDPLRIRTVLTTYGQRNCQLVLAALAAD